MKISLKKIKRTMKFNYNNYKYNTFIKEAFGWRPNTDNKFLKWINDNAK